jgi:hypothetical protein
MVKLHRKICLISLVIRKRQIKASRYYFTYTRMSIIKDNNTYWCGCGETRAFMDLLVDMQDGTARMSTHPTKVQPTPNWPYFPSATADPCRLPPPPRLSQQPTHRAPPPLIISVIYSVSVDPKPGGSLEPTRKPQVSFMVLWIPGFHSGSINELGCKICNCNKPPFPP